MTKGKSAARQPTLLVLRAITKFVSSLNEEEIQAIANGSASLAISNTASKIRGERPIPNEIGREGYLRTLENRLRSADSINDGFAILREANLIRANLEKLVRDLDIPVSKQDSIERLEEKIVEAFIGSRLNSKAVRGT